MKTLQTESLSGIDYYCAECEASNRYAPQPSFWPRHWGCRGYVLSGRGARAKLRYNPPKKKNAEWKIREKVNDWGKVRGRYYFSQTVDYGIGLRKKVACFIR